MILRFDFVKGIFVVNYVRKYSIGKTNTLRAQGVPM